MNNALIFATNNQHKADEIRNATGGRFPIVTLREAGIIQEIPEPFDTLEENASEKSRVILELSGQDCFSEDTGLEVVALNGAPGVKSARFAGENATFEENIDKLLNQMEGVPNRQARFRTVISLRLNGTEHLFEGICEGQITTERRGDGGFGYDPVFVPVGSEKCFAEMSTTEKNSYSHRKKAVDQLVAFLNK